jgi:GNAT superfamily N-acetyltransferase
VAPKHPLFALFDHAARGVFPPVDGAVTITPPLVGGHEAIVCFTGHAVIATRLTLDELGEPAPDGYGSALHPRVQLLMANNGVVGVNDVTLVSEGLGGQPHLTRTEQWNDHPRVAHARALRSDVVVYGDESGFITIGDGLAGRNEMSIEVHEDLHGNGIGRRLIHGARQLTPLGSHLFAAVAPGNARSLRAFLSQGFSPIASEVIITPM